MSDKPPPTTDNNLIVVKTEEEIYNSLVADDVVLKQIDRELEELGASTRASCLTHRRSLVLERREAEATMYKSAEQVAELTRKLAEIDILIDQKPDDFEIKHRKRRRMLFLKQKSVEMHREEEKRCRRDYYQQALGKVVSPPEDRP